MPSHVSNDVLGNVRFDIETYIEDHDDEDFKVHNENLAEILVEISKAPQEHEQMTGGLLAYDEDIKNIEKLFPFLAISLTRNPGKWSREDTRYEFAVGTEHLCRFYKCEELDEQDELLYFWKYVCRKKRDMKKYSDPKEVVSSGYSRGHLTALQDLHSRLCKLELAMGKKGAGKDD